MLSVRRRHRPSLWSLKFPKLALTGEPEQVVGAERLWDWKQTSCTRQGNHLEKRSVFGPVIKAVEPWRGMRDAVFSPPTNPRLSLDTAVVAPVSSHVKEGIQKNGCSEEEGNQEARCEARTFELPSVASCLGNLEGRSGYISKPQHSYL